MTENDIGNRILDSAFTVHRILGPGLLEFVDEAALARELRCRGLEVERQVCVPIWYKGIKLQEGFRADMRIEGKVIVELKSVETVLAVHKKQVLTYLKLTDCRLGYLINFGDYLLKDGITRVINGQLP